MFNSPNEFVLTNMYPIYTFSVYTAYIHSFVKYDLLNVTAFYAFTK